MPLLSVVIPTRNRSKYLLDSIQIALENISDVEIVVCDNSDNDNLGFALEAFPSANKLKYLYSSEPLSVVGNFERALTEASGDYIIFIGDDDAIGPGIEEIALWARKNKIDAIVSYQNSFIASYFWPGVKSKYFGNAYSAQLFINNFSGLVKKINPKIALIQVASRLGGGLGGLPRAYHGLVSRDLIDRIRTRHGHLFGGVSPDIYSATLIASECERAVVVDYPFVIPGASPASTAGQGAQRVDRGGLQTTEHTARFGKALVWDQRIPEFYSPHTVWAYSLCKALDLVPQLGVSPSFGRLYACCLLYYRRHYCELGKAMKELAQKEGYILVTIDLIGGVFSEIWYLSKRLMHRLASPKAGGRAVRYGPHETISSAYEALCMHIARIRIKLRLSSEE